MKAERLKEIPLTDRLREMDGKLMADNPKSLAT
jgi:hypothetical protein